MQLNERLLNKISQRNKIYGRETQLVILKLNSQSIVY